jgi:hypothetical protein
MTIATSRTSARVSRVMAWTLDDFVAEAAKQLQADGWAIARCDSAPDAAWHVAARKGARWLVVQVLIPATVIASRCADKLRLGHTVHLPSKLGRMEQWLAHVRPDGHVTFSHDSLSSSAWATTESDQEVYARLGLSGEERRAIPGTGAPPMTPHS